MRKIGWSLMGGKISRFSCYLLLSLGLHCLFFFLLPAIKMHGGGGWAAALPGRASLLVVQLGQKAPQTPPDVLAVETLSPAAPPGPAEVSAEVARADAGLVPLPVPVEQLSFHPVLLNGEVLEEGAAAFPADLSARVVVEVLVNAEGRVEQVRQQGALNAFAMWLGEQLMTQLRFRPAEAEGQRVSTVVRMEFNLAPGAPAQAPEEVRADDEAIR